ncbi:MAG: prepilin-type N-terminal cleavage/methylation domain-containing protein [Bifidobacteriaceae bacterium]|jgi:prepilin-type N-terminal cleavage/methylation domain-containing protein|nr:prepilin-type N-terminal cleavage/methylation domain-containing protein [Bifidobacteriaceae bacterium]
MGLRIWGKRRGTDQGFAFVELLVVVIIMGVLAAIAIPIFLNQRAKAQDASTRNDVALMAKELAAYWEEHSAPPTIEITENYPQAGDRNWHLRENGSAALTPANFNDSLVAPVSPHVADTAVAGTDWDYSGSSRYDWCFWAYSGRGKEKGFWATASGAVQGADGNAANKCNP